MVINKELIEKISSVYLTPGEFVYLYALYLDEVWSVNLPTESVNKLKTLGFLDKYRGTITSTTYDLISELKGETGESLEDDFDEFWNLYPITDSWGRYPVTRTIRSNRNESEIEYRKHRSTKTKETIHNGLLNYIESLKSAVGSNSLKYMKGPLNFLRDKVYLEYKTPIKPQDFEYGTDLA